MIRAIARGLGGDDATLATGLDILETKIREAMADNYAVAAE